ncbi:uncharacterized protein LOC109537368 isoform X2 [Dendroctonus ponderosae]|uniref:uncharacterized protein LOC109537368 isoform X2 n=1 Tax=Dendroctonus ponderosae TaxID=77166 RepID=UPI0020351850|nr:uncharacterized protein LOC109537368 isoform X2 [Dendroctonus ponderosae]
MDQSTKILDLPSAKHLEAHHWTVEEKIFRRKARILQQIATLNIPLKSGLLYKLKMSIFGPFMKEMNAQEHQNRMFNENKLQILKWHLQRYNQHDTDIVAQRNGFLRNHYDLLKTAVDKCEIIDLGFFRNNLKYLQLDCCFIKEMDNSLQKFEQLRMLTLSGNFLMQVPGIMLPRSLVFLELFDNLIEDLSEFLRHLPKNLRHLGLGRNQLKDDCLRHLLGATQQLCCLKCLDLSDNDMHALSSTLHALQNCSSLTALSLEGNPCSMLPSYRASTLRLLPHLLILDGRKILETDRQIYGEPKTNCLPQLIFQCFRIMGLPEPPKDKKNAQTIHVEVNFPLLSECGSVEEAAANQPPVPDADATGPEEIPKIAAKNPKKKGNKKDKKKSYFSGENEYDEQKELQNCWFKSEPVAWAKIMQFPATQVENLPNKSMEIRDTFRSIVPVRIVYLKFRRCSL